MDHEKITSLFDLSLDKMIKSLHKLPNDEGSQHIKFNIVMKHPAGKMLRAGICHCRDRNGNFKWMRCEDCQQNGQINNLPIKFKNSKI